MITTNDGSTKRKRNNSSEEVQISKKGFDIIRLPLSLEEHNISIIDRKNYVTFLDFYIKKYPELFPANFAGNFGVHDKRQSSKLDFEFLRIKHNTTGKVYSILPCDVLPYMTGKAAEVMYGLLLIMYGVPTWLIVKCLGRSIDFWQSLFLSFGHCSIVGTTLKTKSNAPQHITIDEKITWWKGTCQL